MGLIGCSPTGVYSRRLPTVNSSVGISWSALLLGVVSISHSHPPSLAECEETPLFSFCGGVSRFPSTGSRLCPSSPRLPLPVAPSYPWVRSFILRLRLIEEKLICQRFDLILLTGIFFYFRKIGKMLLWKSLPDICSPAETFQYVSIWTALNCVHRAWRTQSNFFYFQSPLICLGLL